MLGGVSGYCVAHTLALGIAGSWVGVPLGFIAAAAVYTLINPREKVLLNCLKRAGLVFAGNMITKEEYRAMRRQCIRAHEKAGPQASIVKFRGNVARQLRRSAPY